MTEPDEQPLTKPKKLLELYTGLQECIQKSNRLEQEINIAQRQKIQHSNRAQEIRREIKALLKELDPDL